MLSVKQREAVRDRLQALNRHVVLHFFEASLGCLSCPEVRSLLRDVAEQSERLEVVVHNLYIDEDEAKRYQVDRAPAIVVTDQEGTDYGIRFFGAPSGYEFATFLDAILMVGTGDSGLSAGTKARLAELKAPVDLKVFVTPTCPYCPAAVRLAHRFALESPLVTASMIEATEFPDWATRFNVYGVPKTVINDSEAYALEGAVPEDVLLEQVLATQA